MEVHRYKVLSCERTFRHYRVGVGQSGKTLGFEVLFEGDGRAAG